MLTYLYVNVYIKIYLTLPLYVKDMFLLISNLNIPWISILIMGNAGSTLWSKKKIYLNRYCERKITLEYFVNYFKLSDWLKGYLNQQY